MTKLTSYFVLLAAVYATIASAQTPQQAILPSPEMQGIVATQLGSNAESTSTAEKELVALTNDWTEAINSRNREKLDELMSPEYALYAWNGKMAASRSVWLDNLFSHITIEKNTLTDVAPRVYGDLAIITSKGDWIGYFDGRHFNKKCMIVDTWRMFIGGWNVVTRTSDCSGPVTRDSVKGS